MLTERAASAALGGAQLGFDVIDLGVQRAPASQVQPRAGNADRLAASGRVDNAAALVVLKEQDHGKTEMTRRRPRPGGRPRTASSLHWTFRARVGSVFPTLR